MRGKCKKTQIPLDQLRSLLQKGIRRGKKDLAWNAASLLAKNGLPNAVWNALFVIALEDIGPANPLYAVHLCQWNERWRENLRKSKKMLSQSHESLTCMALLCKAVHKACESAKSRMNHYFAMISLDKVAGMEECAQPRHVAHEIEARAQRVIQDEKDYAELVKLIGLCFLTRTQHLLLEEVRILAPQPELEKDVERFPWHLFIVHHILCLRYRTLSMEEKDLTPPHGLTFCKDNRDEEMKPEDVPDWALDKHTSAGKKKGRGLAHFFEEGCHLVRCRKDMTNGFMENEALFKEETKKIYMAREKKVGLRNTKFRHYLDELRGPVKRTRQRLFEIHPKQLADVFPPEKTLLAQVPTNRDRMLTFHVEDTNELAWFIKGPAVKKHHVDEFETLITMNEQKKKMIGVTPIEEMDIVEYYVNEGALPKGILTPPGVEEGKAYAFLKMTNLFEYMPNQWHTTLKKTTRTTEEGVKVPMIGEEDRICHLNVKAVCAALDHYDMGIIHGLMLALAFRFVFEISDTCERNFIVDWSNHKVYSVDEGSVAKGIRPHLFKVRMKEANRKHYIEAFRIGFPHVRKVLCTWLLTAEASPPPFLGDGFRLRYKKNIEILEESVENWIQLL